MAKEKAVKKKQSVGRPPLEADRMNKIMEQAAALFYKKGYTNTSTREIAEACGISKGLLYYYIGSKEAIMEQMIKNSSTYYDTYNARILKQLSSNPASAILKSAITEYLQDIDKTQDVIMLWYHESGNMTPSQLEIIKELDLKVVAGFESIVRAGYKSGEFSGSDPVMAAYQIYSICITWVTKRWFLRSHYTLEEYIKQTVNNALHMVGYKKA